MRIVPLVVCLILFISDSVSYSQNQSIEGAIIEVSETSVKVAFDQITLSVGDELLFVRHHEIIDPITNRVRGGRDEDIATGIVEDIGLGYAEVNIIQSSQQILLTDKVVYTGRVKRVTRTNEVIGTVQTLINENEIEIDVGEEEEISEGDMFLIRRTENIYNPETNEVVDTRSIDVGRGRVDSVNQGGSRASIVEFLPGLTVEESDEVVFEPEPPVPAQEPAVVVDSSEVDRLNGEIDALKSEVALLRAVVDSMRSARLLQQVVASPQQTVTARLPETRQEESIQKRDDNNLPDNLPAELTNAYRRALDDCLNGEYEDAIAGFTNILANYPNQQLAENSRYWIGQSKFSAGDFTGALEQFRQVVVDTRYTHKDDDAAIMMGITRYSMGQVPEALLELESFLRQYPDSEYRKRAQALIDKIS